MSSFNQQINRFGQFIIVARVCAPTRSKEEFDNTFKHAKGYRALVDTGATGCCISKQVVTDLALKPYTKKTISTAGKPYISSVYAVDLAISVTQTALRPERQKDGGVVLKEHSMGETSMTFQQVTVFEVPDVGADRGFDVILGMDVLMHLHITIFSGQIIISI